MRTLSLSLALLLAGPLAQASGQLDPRFGGDGVLTIETSATDAGTDHLYGGLIDAAGRYVGVGRATSGALEVGSVVRVGPGGLLDPGFGAGGIAHIAPLQGYSNLFLNQIAEQPDGKLILAGTNLEDAFRRAYVCRLRPDGSPDPQFGTGGCVQPPFWADSNVDLLLAMVLQPDGRILLLGLTDADNGVGESETVVARLDSDGTFDSCFADVSCQHGGIVIEPEPGSFFPQAMALAPDGRIVVAGTAFDAGSNQMAALRLLPTGGIDPAFGNGGVRLVAFDQGGANSDVAKTVTVAGNGAVLLAGDVQTGNFGTLTGVAALDANGAPVAAFGSGGKTLLFFNDVAPQHVATQIALQDDGKLLVAGYTDGPELTDCALARLLPDGELDPVFAFDGKLSIDGGLGNEPARTDRCFGLDAAGGAIVLFGARPPDGGDSDAMMLRFDQDGTFRDGFE
jgi:uncharacterized delta-60 repeat protein